MWLVYYLLATLLTTKMRMRRPSMVLLLPWIALDCLGNMVIGGSPRNTLSGEAWNHRRHVNFWWTHGAIDTLFGEGHCRKQAEAEAAHGSVWHAWAAEWRGV